MSKGGGSQTTTTTQQIDPAIMGLIQGNVSRSTGIADQPYQAYDPSNLVAPLSQNQNLAIQGAQNLGHEGSNAINSAISGAQGILGYQPQQIVPGGAGVTFANAAQNGTAPHMDAYGANAAQINRGDISNLSGGDLLSGIQKYQNPYTNDVINASMADLERQRQIQQVHDNQSATAARAFGGSRQGVADALTNEAYNRNAGLLASQLRQQGFDTASSLAQSDAARAFNAAAANQGMDYSVANQNANFLQQGNQFNAANRQAADQYNTGLLGQFLSQNTSNQQQANLANAGQANQTALANTGAYNSALLANQNAGLQGAGLNLSASNALGALGGQQQNMYSNYINSLIGTGALQQSPDQQLRQAQYDEFLRQLNYPIQGQQVINQSLGLLPQSGTTTQTGPGQDTTGQTLGGLGALASGVGMIMF